MQANEPVTDAGGGPLQALVSRYWSSRGGGGGGELLLILEPNGHGEIMHYAHMSGCRYAQELRWTFQESQPESNSAKESHKQMEALVKAIDGEEDPDQNGGRSGDASSIPRRWLNALLPGKSAQIPAPSASTGRAIQHTFASNLVNKPDEIQAEPPAPIRARYSLAALSGTLYTHHP